MRLNHAVIALMLSAGSVAPAAVLTACAGDGLAYGSSGHQHQRWNRGEDRFYRRWETRTHRGHLDFQRRDPADQRSYWHWRHSRSSNSHGRH